MTASVANITSSGNRNAKRRSRIIAPENRAIAPTGVKLAIFAAGINGGWQIAEELVVEFAACESAIQNFGVYTSGNGPKSGGMEILDKLASVPLPDRENSSHADAGEIPFAIGTEIFK